jgi:hypothetical protein
MFRFPLKPSSGGSMTVLRYVTESKFQFSNVAKYVHGPPDNGFKADRN